MNITNLLMGNDWSWILASVAFLVGYTYTTKVNNTTTVDAAHVNLLQTEKIDRDGDIPLTGVLQWDKGADVASGAALALGSDGNYFDITGTTSITSITQTDIGTQNTQSGTVVKLHFDGALTVTHHATNLILPGGANILTAAGDEMEFTRWESGWRCTGYTPAAGRPVRQNLITNSGLGCWSNSDANKGLAAVPYDAGDSSGHTALVVGEAITGGTSSATGKLISYTVTGGTWAGANAAGVLTLGACTGVFIDNETLTGGTGSSHCLVNGDETFAVASDPCNTDDSADWTKLPTTDNVVAFDTDHYTWTSTNANDIIYKVCSLTAGKLYKISAYIKDGTASSQQVVLYLYDGAAQTSAKIYTTAAGGETITWTFEAATTLGSTARVGLKLLTDAAGNNIQVKNFVCYEITPCCTAADAVAVDRFTKDTTLDVYRQHDDGGTLTKDGSFYAMKLVPSATADWVDWSDNSQAAIPVWYQAFAGRTVTFGAWIKASTASHARLQVIDSAATSSSGYHTGGGSWEWIEVSHATAAAPTSFKVRIDLQAAANVDGTTVVYVSQPMLIFGTSIGSGNYHPIIGETIYLDQQAASALLDARTGANGFSDVSATTINIEADSDGKIPKGIKAFYVYANVNDSGSAGTECLISLDHGATTWAVNVSASGLANDLRSRQAAWTKCDANGDYRYTIDATGSNTFDINAFKYLAVQL